MMKKSIILILITVLFSACKEDTFLEETPLDFASANSSYVTEADFDASIVELYYLTRLEFYTNGGYSQDFMYGTDFMRGSGLLSNLESDYSSTSGSPEEHWNKLYLLISQANVVLTRLPTSEISVENQVIYEAKAKFFRGFAYRTLAYLYGGVPLSLEEVTSPKTDYVRSTKEETLQQAITDVKFAAQNLKSLDDIEDGEISYTAAYHLLAELYLATGQNEKAVDAATEVINNSGLSLMQSRFGTRSSEDGDVYWDLFRKDNQNHSSGNTEGIWVIQQEVDVPGGGADTSVYFWTTPGNYLLERYCSPQVGLFRMVLPDGTQLVPFDWPVGDYSGGRGIGNVIATSHFHDEIWASDFDNDIRNSNYNFVRKFAYNNPSFIEEYGGVFGDTIDISNPPQGVTFITNTDSRSTFPNRYLMGYQTKGSMPFNYPDALWDTTSDTPYKLRGSAGGTYTDQYMFRLAETYLLRAEAYLKQGNTGAAAIDINSVRNRAHASLVLAGEVDINYILDERLRELGIEEKRRLTLGRLGSDIFYDRVTKYNPFYAASDLTANGAGFNIKHTLWPIPQSAIEANKDAVLNQNPDY